MKSLILALAVLFGSATCEAADSFYFSNGQFSIAFGNPTFRPQPRHYGPPMTYRGDWVPYQYAYPQSPYYGPQRPSQYPPRHYPHQYNHRSPSRHGGHSHGHR